MKVSLITGPLHLTSSWSHKAKDDNRSSHSLPSSAIMKTSHASRARLILITSWSGLKCLMICDQLTNSQECRAERHCTPGSWSLLYGAQHGAKSVRPRKTPLMLVSFTLLEVPGHDMERRRPQNGNHITSHNMTRQPLRNFFPAARQN